MSVLRSLEDKIAGLVEGTFGRAFRSEVRPVELARRLTREMDQHRSVSLSRTYVPSHYTVFLSPSDRERFAGFEAELTGELAGHLLEHARRERYALVSRPEVELRTDPRLGLGLFGIQAQLVRAAEGAGAAVEPAGHSHTMVYSTHAAAGEPLEARPEPAPPPRGAELVMDGRRLPVGPRGAVLGRSRDCDIVLADPNVSRRHAHLRPAEGGWEVVDLGSTNGVRVDGEAITGPRALRPGDRLALGTSELRFELGA